MANPFRSIIRASAFLRKELYEILRQPRLIITLVLGPFLILAIFGAGYRNDPRKLRTLFVAPDNSPVAASINQYAPTLGPQLIYMGITPDQHTALDRLRRGDVDLVVIPPDNATEAIKSNHQAVFTLYHREIDPFQVNYIDYFGSFYTNIVNQQILEQAAEQGQQQSALLKQDINAAHESAAALRTALQSGDQAGIAQHSTELGQNITALQLVAGASLGLLSNVQATYGPGNGLPNTGSSSLADLQQNSQALAQGDTQSKINHLAAIENDLNSLNSQIDEFRNVSPEVLVNPFTSDVKSVAPIQPTASDYFAPAVLAMLLQHLAVTFAALSIVRERTSGTMELFRVSPLSAFEALTGKYISYMVFGIIIAAILSALTIFGLNLPMLGSWRDYAIVIVALLFTSLGIGFIISIVSQTDTQAVQYTMIVLLASVFFSGFVAALSMLLAPVQIISWMLPVTYGSVMLRDIALRGLSPDLTLLVGLVAIGVVLWFVAWMLLKRQISSQK